MENLRVRGDDDMEPSHVVILVIVALVLLPYIISRLGNKAEDAISNAIARKKNADKPQRTEKLADLYRNSDTMHNVPNDSSYGTTNPTAHSTQNDVPIMQFPTQEVKAESQAVSPPQQGLHEVLHRLNNAKGHSEYASAVGELEKLAEKDEVAAQKLQELSAVIMENGVFVCRVCSERQQANRTKCARCGIIFRIVEACEVEKEQEATNEDRSPCLSCGRDLLPGDTFCRGCGTNIPIAVEQVLEPMAGEDKNVCAKCGRELLRDDAFCRGCGEEVKVAAEREPDKVLNEDKELCSDCGRELLPGDVFCRGCGTTAHEDTSCAPRNQSHPVQQNDFSVAPVTKRPRKYCAKCGLEFHYRDTACVICSGRLSERAGG